MTVPTRVANTISFFCLVYSLSVLADVPVLRDTPTRPFTIIGQLKQGECKKNSSETQAQMKKRVIDLSLLP